MFGGLEKPVEKPGAPRSPHIQRKHLISSDGYFLCIVNKLKKKRTNHITFTQNGSLFSLNA